MENNSGFPTASSPDLTSPSVHFAWVYATTQLPTYPRKTNRVVQSFRLKPQPLNF